MLLESFPYVMVLLRLPRLFGTGALHKGTSHMGLQEKIGDRCSVLPDRFKFYGMVVLDGRNSRPTH